MANRKKALKVTTSTKPPLDLTVNSVIAGREAVFLFFEPVLGLYVSAMRKSGAYYGRLGFTGFATVVLLIVVFSAGAAGHYDVDRNMEVYKRSFAKEVEDVSAIVNVIVRELAEDEIRLISENFDDFLAKADFSGVDMDVKLSFVSSLDNAKGAAGAIVEYPIGQYVPNDAAIKLIVGLLEEAFDRKLSRFREYLDVKVVIKGSADSTPLPLRTAFRGEEAINSVHYFNVNENRFKYKTLVPGESNLTNEDLAFLRAYYLRKEVQHIGIFSGTSLDIEVQESDKLGRQAIVVLEFKIRDVLRPSYDKLNPLGKIAFNVRDFLGEVFNFREAAA